jgi:hypothetical protein
VSALDLLADADRLVIDGSTWSGDGLERLHQLAELVVGTRLAVSDFALARQSRLARRSPWSSTIPTSCRISATCAGSRSRTRPTTRARPGRRTWSPIYHVGRRRRAWTWW